MCLISANGGDVIKKIEARAAGGVLGLHVTEARFGSMDPQHLFTCRPREYSVGCKYFCDDTSRGGIAPSVARAEGTVMGASVRRLIDQSAGKKLKDVIWRRSE